MKRLLFICIFLMGLFSSMMAENFSNMSTQELIAIMGYVKPQNQKAFEKELKSRITTMSSSEKKQYKKNLKRMGK